MTRYQTVTGRAKWCTYGLIACIGLDVMSISLNLLYVMGPTDENKLLVEFASLIVYIGNWLVYIVTVVLFLRWLHLSFKNAEGFGTVGMKFTAYWAVCWWFVPLFWLWKPLEATKELWRTTDPSCDLQTWKDAPVPIIMTLWWIAWVMCNIIGNASFQKIMRGDPSNLAVQEMAGLATSLFSILAAACLIRIVKQITSRQERKAAFMGIDRSESY